jgi:hypothetical protein
MEDNKKLLEENIRLQKEIFKLQDELHMIKQNNEIIFFKNKIYNLIEEINNNKITDINREIYLYIHNIKYEHENKFKNNFINQQCDYLLYEIEHNNIDCKEKFLNKLKYIINI